MEKIGKIQMIAINRPEKRNAVDPPTAVQLFQAIKDSESDEEATVAVLHGKGVVIISPQKYSCLRRDNLNRTDLLDLDWQVNLFNLTKS